MITGADEISKSILDMMIVGVDRKEILDQYHISEDQYKKLSRLSKIYRLSEANLQPPIMSRLRELGLKALVLSTMFTQEDWEGVTEVISSVESTIKRDDLAHYPALIAEKRKRIADNRKAIEQKLAALEYQQKQLEQKVNEAEQNNADMEKNLAFFKKYPNEITEFLAAHVGLADGRPCLSRRVYQDWHKKLKKEGLIEYDELDYIYYIPDITAFADEALRHYKSKGRLEFDSDKDEWGNSPFYRSKGINRISSNLLKKAEELKQEIELLNKEKRQCEKEIREFRHQRSETFLEAVLASNQLSIKDMQSHGELQDFGLRWLYQRRYASIAELTNGTMRYDVIGYNFQQRITIIEAKASIEDFRRDNKWNNYLKFCDEFFFVFDQSTFDWHQEEIINTIGGAGVIIKGSHTPAKHCTLELVDMDSTNRQSLVFAIGQTLSKKFTFGH